MECKYGHINVIEGVISLGTVVHHKEYYNMTSLMIECLNGHIDDVHILLIAGAKVNETKWKCMYNKIIY